MTININQNGSAITLGTDANGLTVNGTPLTFSAGSAFTSGSILYSSASTAPTGFLACNGSTVAVASYPTLSGVLPTKAGIPAGLGAQYGTAASQSVTVDASSYLNSQFDVNAGVQNLTDAIGTNNTTYPGDYPVWHSANSMPNVWLRFALPQARVITSYYLMDRNTGGISPTQWSFQGSNDNTNWTTLHTINNGYTRLIVGNNASSGITTSVMSGWSFTNTTAYFYYRFVFAATTSGTGGYVALSEVALVGGGTTADPNSFVLPSISSDTTKFSNGIATVYGYIKT